MKLKKIALLATTSILALGLIGCGTDSDTSETSITISGSNTVKAGQSIKLTGGVEASGKITDLTNTFTSEGLSDAQLELVDIGVTSDTDDDATEFDFEDIGLTITTEEEACTADYVYTMTVTTEGGSASKTFAFSVTDGKDCSATALGEAKMDTIYNVQGPLKGAYDLKAGAQVGSSGDSTIKDLKDMSLAATTDDLFSMEFSSGNGAMFAIVEGLDFATVTDADLATAAEAATFTAKSGKLKDGDIVIAKLSEARGGALVVIHVKTAKDDVPPANDGYIAFEYKM